MSSSAGVSTAPKTKQYMYQSQDELHYLRVSLALSITNHLLVPHQVHMGSSATDAFSLRIAPSAAGSRPGNIATTNFNHSTDSVPAAGASFASMGSVGATSAAAAAGGATPHAKVIEIQGLLWSLCEDKLIVRAEEARADIAQVYQAFHRANPVFYPKTYTDSAPFKDRLAVLQSDDATRLKMVQALPDDAMTHLSSEDFDSLSRKSSGLFQSMAMSGSAIGGPPGAGNSNTRSTALKAFKKFQQQGKGGRSGSTSAGGGSAGMYRKEDLIITGVVRQGTEQSDVSCCSEDVTAQSPLLRDMFRKSSDYLTGGARRVTLSEKDPMWATIPDMSSVFASDNLHRFKNFCEAPQMLTALVDLHERLKYKETQADDEWNRFVQETFETRDDQLTLLEGYASNTVASMRGRLEASLERDIEALRQVYHAHMHQEEKTLRLYFDQQRTNIELFYEREMASLAALRTTIDAKEPESITELRAELAALSEMTSDTYGGNSSQLPRLLMLSDVLLCNELRTQCLKLIASDVSRYAVMPEMNSQLLRANTFRELMTIISDTELQRLHRLTKAKNPATYRGIPLAIIEAERNERGVARAQDLLKRDLKDIQELSRRVNLHMVKLKQQQAQSILSPADSVGLPGGGAMSPRGGSAMSPRGGSHGGGDRFSQAVRAAHQFTKVQEHPKTLEALRKGFTEEEMYVGWRELLQDTLSRKLQHEGGELNAAVLRVPKGLEGACSLLPHRRGFDAKQCFKHLTAEGQGCITIGESYHLLYWETRVVFVDSGTRFPANVWIGMDPVMHSMNHVQVEKLRGMMLRERDESVTAHAISSERMAREAADAHVAVGPTISAMQNAMAPAQALMRNFFALSSLNANVLVSPGERAVGVTPVNVAAPGQPNFPVHGFSWANDGIVYHEGIPFDIKCTYDTGDVIGVAVHSMTGEVHLYKNEQRIISTDKTVAWPRLRQGTTYQPAVTCYCTSLPTGSQPQAAALLHQSATADEDTVVVSHTAGVFPPKSRIIVELDGRCRVMPSGSIPYSRGAAPAVLLQRTLQSE